MPEFLKLVKALDGMLVVVLVISALNFSANVFSQAKSPSTIARAYYETDSALQIETKSITQHNKLKSFGLETGNNDIQITAYLDTPINFTLPETPVESIQLPDWMNIQGNTLHIEFNNKSQFGVYKFVLPGLNENYNLTVRTEYPEINTSELQAQLQNIITDYSEDTTYFVHDIKRDITLEHRSDELFPPGSITKLPYGILIMHDIQNGKFTLDTPITVREDLKAYKHDYMYSYGEGTVVPLSDALYLLYSQSDNTAMRHLEELLGGYDVVKARIKNELGLDTFFRDPNDGSSRSVYKLLMMIYTKNPFLSDFSRQYLLNNLINCNPVFWNRIRGGIPEGYTVANKIGNLDSDYGVAISDSAIVYGIKSDYIIVVITKDYPDEETASVIEQRIGQAVFEEFEQSSTKKLNP